MFLERCFAFCVQKRIICFQIICYAKHSDSEIQISKSPSGFEETEFISMAKFRSHSWHRTKSKNTKCGRLPSFLAENRLNGNVLGLVQRIWQCTIQPNNCMRYRPSWGHSKANYGLELGRETAFLRRSYLCRGGLRSFVKQKQKANQKGKVCEQVTYLNLAPAKTTDVKLTDIYRVHLTNQTSRIVPIFCSI